MLESAVQIRYIEFVRRTGRIESTDSVREFLHMEILRIISTQNLGNLILHGGCKTRYIDGSPRYSMDMDFSLGNFIDIPKVERKEMVDNAISPIIRDLGNIGITLNLVREQWHRGETGVKVCFKANTLKDIFSGIFTGHHGDINFNIDIDALLPGERVQTSAPIADRSLSILVLDDSSHMARKVAAVMLRKQLRDLYDLDMYINRGIKYDLMSVRVRLNKPNLTHTELEGMLCQRIQELDIKKRVHQLHLPTESSRMAFVDQSERIANIKRMLPLAE